jgi:hypothetical protein
MRSCMLSERGHDVSYTDRKISTIVGPSAKVTRPQSFLRYELTEGQVKNVRDLGF